MKLSQFFTFLAFAYTVGIIGYAMMQPLTDPINNQWLYGVIGLMPVAFFAPLAIPAIILLVIGMVIE